MWFVWVRRGTAWQGKARVRNHLRVVITEITGCGLMRIGKVRQGSVRHGRARRGRAGCGEAVQGIETPQKTVESSWNSQPWTDES